MSSSAIMLIVFVCVFGSALLGMVLRRILPAQHLDDASKEIVKLGTGLIATMAALVLGMLTSTAKTTFDRTNDELVQSAAKIVLLDRVLAQYGPETKEIRASVKQATTAAFERLLSGDDAKIEQSDTPEAVSRTEALAATLRALAPQNDSQRALQSRAIEIGNDVLATRWLVLLQKQGTISLPLLGALVFWLALIFTSFGLFAPRNPTVLTVLFLCAFSVASAIFLILELEHPFDGIVKIDSAPILSALAHLGQ